jgi:hypothetical protein
MLYTPIILPIHKGYVSPIIVVLKKRPVWGARCAWEDTIKMDYKIADCEGVQWI